MIMKSKLHYMKLMTCILIILPVISMLSLQAQDYLVSFAGSGTSTTVTTIKVENLIQGTSLEINGNDVLHLMGVVTGIETAIDNKTGKIYFYPNPMKDYARMQFDLPETGEVIITLYDLSGRKIVQTQDLLLKGQHTYGIKGVEEGINFIRINSGKYSLNGKLISAGSQSSNPKIEYDFTDNIAVSPEKQNDSKGINEENVMQYNTGDRLKLTGISGNYSTVITDMPSESKTITFYFIPCTDGDGNNYPVVQIGTQTWMAENLKTKKYLNGDLIGTTTPASSNISGETTPKYQWAYNGNEANVTTYGRLYTWYAITDNRNVCPTEWHLPNDAEWTALTTCLGEDVAGGKLKETGLDHWDSPNTGATNETGFTALPTGFRYRLNGNFNDAGTLVYFWSSTQYEFDPIKGYYRELFNDNATVYREAAYKTAGKYVRCLKN